MIEGFVGFQKIYVTQVHFCEPFKLEGKWHRHALDCEDDRDGADVIVQELEPNERGGKPVGLRKALPVGTVVEAVWWPGRKEITA